MFEQEIKVQFYPLQLLINYLNYKDVFIEDEGYWRLWENVNSKYLKSLESICNIKTDYKQATMLEKTAIVDSLIINLCSIIDIVEIILYKTHNKLINCSEDGNLKGYKRFVDKELAGVEFKYTKNMYVKNLIEIRNLLIHGGVDVLATDNNFYIDIVDFKTDSYVNFSTIYSRCPNQFCLLVDAFEFFKYYLNLIKYRCYDLIRSFINKNFIKSSESFEEIIENINPDLFVNSGVSARCSDGLIFEYDRNGFTFYGPEDLIKIKELERYLETNGDDNINFSLKNYEKDFIKVSGYKNKLYDPIKSLLREVEKIDENISLGTDLLHNYKEIMMRSFFSENGLEFHLKKMNEEDILILIPKNKFNSQLKVKFKLFCEIFLLRKIIDYEACLDSSNNYCLFFKKSDFLNCRMHKSADFSRLSSRYKKS